LGYLIGSFPTAFLLVKIRSKIDIRTAGSGNVGARNAYDVTGSKSTGWIVFVIDFTKGAFTILICRFIVGNEWTAALGGFGAVLGHIFNPWLGFNGGRGLATTAGVLILMGWVYVFIWCTLYLIFNAYLKQVNLSSVIASMLSPIIMLFLPVQLVTSVCYPNAGRETIIVICTVLSVIILIGHREPINDFFTKKKE
jgi:acyl phosphate:glycerol-3-phosphate acyltransferase